MSGEEGPEEEKHESPILNAEAAERKDSDSKAAFKKRRTNAAENAKLYDAYNAGKAREVQTYIRDFNKTKEWALVMDMTWLHNILMFLEDIQVIEETSKKKEHISFYEKAHSIIKQMNTNFNQIGDPEERSVFRSGTTTRQDDYARARVEFWTKTETKQNMQFGKQLLELFFQSQWSLFVEQAEISIISFLDPSCSILSEGLVPHWTMYIGDQFLRTYFVQLLNYHKMVSAGSKQQKVTFLKFYKKELDAYRSRIDKRFMMRFLKSDPHKFEINIEGTEVQNLSTQLTLWIMYQNNLPFRALGPARSEELKFEKIVENLFAQNMQSVQHVTIEENIKYIQNAWNLGIPTRFVTSSFHPIELSYVLEYMYGKDRFRMLRWETFIRWYTREDKQFQKDFEYRLGDDRTVIDSATVAYGLERDESDDDGA